MTDDANIDVGFMHGRGELGPSAVAKIGFYGETRRPFAEVLDVELDRYEAAIRERLTAPPPRRPWRRKARAEYDARRAAERAVRIRALDAIDDERFRRETAAMTDLERTVYAMRRTVYAMRRAGLIV